MPRITELVGRHRTLGQADEDSALGVGIHKRAFICTTVITYQVQLQDRKRDNSDWNGCQALAWQLSCLCCWLVGCHRTRCTADKDCALYLKCGDSAHSSTFTGTTFRSLPLIKQLQLLTLRQSLKFLLRRGEQWVYSAHHVDNSFFCLTLALTSTKAFMIYHAVVDVWANFKQEEPEVWTRRGITR